MRAEKVLATVTEDLFRPSRGVRSIFILLSQKYKCLVKIYSSDSTATLFKRGENKKTEILASY